MHSFLPCMHRKSGGSRLVVNSRFTIVPNRPMLPHQMICAPEWVSFSVCGQSARHMGQWNHLTVLIVMAGWKWAHENAQDTDNFLSR
jgi:hypothetical protein